MTSVTASTAGLVTKHARTGPLQGAVPGATPCQGGPVVALAVSSALPGRMNGPVYGRAPAAGGPPGARGSEPSKV